VVEDEIRLSRQLAKALAEAGYAVDRAIDGQQADFLANTEQYDAVILDLGLPKIDGLTLLRQWRSAGMLAPVLILIVLPVLIDVCSRRSLPQDLQEAQTEPAE